MDFRGALILNIRILLVRAIVNGHTLFVVPALAGPPKDGTASANYLGTSRK